MSEEPTRTVADSEPREATPSGRVADGVPAVPGNTGDTGGAGVRFLRTTAFGRGARLLARGIRRVFLALWAGLCWLWAILARIGRSLRAGLTRLGRGLRAGLTRLGRGLRAGLTRLGRGLRTGFAAAGRGLRAGARGTWRGAGVLTPWVVTAVGFAAGAAYLDNNHDVGNLPVLYAAVQALPVAMAAYRPMAGWALAFLGALTIPLLALPLDDSTPWPWTPVVMLTYPFVQYFVARNRSRTVSIATWALMSVGVTTLMGELGPSRIDLNDNQVMFGALALVGLVIGDTTRVRRQARQKVAEQLQLSAEERASRQMLEERTRIARELHDVVAHHMSVIAVQSSTAAYRLEELPESARAEFIAIGDSARESLAELRRLLAVLRSDDEAAQRAPQPGLDRLDELVDVTRRAGSPVTVAVGALPPDLPDVVGLAAYRIVQEALSNVVRHAPGAAIQVEVSLVLGYLRVCVQNDPPERPAGVGGESTVGVGGGHGIVGMRERVAALGGRIEVQPRPDGGFRVEALLPTAPEAEPDSTTTT